MSYPKFPVTEYIETLKSAVDSPVLSSHISIMADALGDVMDDFYERDIEDSVMDFCLSMLDSLFMLSSSALRYKRTNRAMIVNNLVAVLSNLADTYPTCSYFFDVPRGTDSVFSCEGTE